MQVSGWPRLTAPTVEGPASNTGSSGFESLVSYGALAQWQRHQAEGLVSTGSSPVGATPR